jgi:hypothetical protein
LVLHDFLKLLTTILLRKYRIQSLHSYVFVYFKFYLELEPVFEIFENIFIYWTKSFLPKSAVFWNLYSILHLYYTYTKLVIKNYFREMIAEFSLVALFGSENSWFLYGEEHSKPKIIWQIRFQANTFNWWWQPCFDISHFATLPAKKTLFPK